MKRAMRRFRERALTSLCDRLFASRSFRRMALRKLFAEHMPASSLAYVSSGDHSFFVDPRDHMIAFQLLSGQGWQRQMFDDAVQTALHAGVLRKGGWFIDVGANIGTQTVYAMRSGHFCGAIAIEPDPHNFDLLQRNIKLNGLDDRVRLVQAAASCCQGHALLRLDEKNFGAHRIVPDTPTPSGRLERVVTLTVDEILARQDINPTDVGFVWIDVEGHEVEVLRGMPLVRGCGVPIVSEVAAAQNGSEQVELKRLLTPNYNSIHALNTGSVSTAKAKELAQFRFGSRQSDVLFFNRLANPGGMTS